MTFYHKQNKIKYYDLDINCWHTQNDMVQLRSHRY